MKKTLLVYFTYTGHTQLVADKIKFMINCDVLKLEPKTPYSKNYQTVVNAYQNSNNENRTEILKPHNINLDNYDTIIIGSPVWWYTITPVIRTFLKENNLSSKIIIPFTTSAGWPGKAINEIKKWCFNSIIKNEINIIFNEDYEKPIIKNQNEFNDWLNSLNL